MTPPRSNRHRPAHQLRQQQIPRGAEVHGEQTTETTGTEAGWPGTFVATP